MRATDGDDHRAAIASLLVKIESIEPIALHAHRGIEAKLRFLRDAVGGIPWPLHATSRLPAVYPYAELIDAWFDALRAINIHKGAGGLKW